MLYQNYKTPMSKSNTLFQEMMEEKNKEQNFRFGEWWNELSLSQQIEYKKNQIERLRNYTNKIHNQKIQIQDELDELYPRLKYVEDELRSLLSVEEIEKKAKREENQDDPTDEYRDEQFIKNNRY